MMNQLRVKSITRKPNHVSVDDMEMRMQKRDGKRIEIIISFPRGD